MITVGYRQSGLLTECSTFDEKQWRHLFRNQTPRINQTSLLIIKVRWYWVVRILISDLSSDFHVSLYNCTTKQPTLLFWSVIPYTDKCYRSFQFSFTKALYAWLLSTRPLHYQWMVSVVRHLLSNHSYEGLIGMNSLCTYS